MIETLFRQRFADPEEWFEKVTRLSSAGQQPRRKEPVLERICEIVSRLDQSTGKRIRLPPGTAATHRRFRQSASGFRVGSEVTTEGRSNGTAHFATNFSELGLRPEADCRRSEPCVGGRQHAAGGGGPPNAWSRLGEGPDCPQAPERASISPVRTSARFLRR